MMAREMIRKAMEDRGLLQHQLAIAAGLSKAYLSDILAGRRGISLSAAKRLCPKLGLKTAEVLKQQVDDLLVGRGAGNIPDGGRELRKPRDSDPAT